VLRGTASVDKFVDPGAAAVNGLDDVHHGFVAEQIAAFGVAISPASKKSTASAFAALMCSAPV